MSVDVLPRTPARVSLSLLTLVLAIVLLTLSWPRWRANLAHLPVDTALSHIWTGDTPSADQLAALSSRAEQASALHDTYAYQDSLSILNYLQAQVPGLDADQRQELLQQSAEAALQSLRQAPMKPAAWLRAALAYKSLGVAPDIVTRFLLMSIYTGRVEPNLLLLRLQTMYDLQRHLDADGRRLLLDQTLLTWRLQPRPLVQSVRSGAIPYHRIAAVLAPANGAVLNEIDGMIRGSVR
jgi:hypothetical protein